MGNDTLATGSGTTFSTDLPKPGTYKASLTVTDNHDLQGSDTLTVTAEPTDDNGDEDRDSGGPDRTIVIKGTNSGGFGRYRFTVSGALQKASGTVDGIPVSVNVGDTVSGSHASGVVYGGADGYRFSGQIQDFSLNPRGEATIYVDGEEWKPNIPPHPQFTVSPKSPNPDQQVTFDGSGSRDPDGTIQSYHWEIEMGNDSLTSGSGKVFTTKLPTTGTYSASLTVTDNDGAEKTKRRSVSTDTPAPTASIKIHPASPTPGSAVTLDGSGSTDPDGSIKIYKWQVTRGDGARLATKQGKQVTIRAPIKGRYRVSLTVTDDDGLTDHASTTIVSQYPPYFFLGVYIPTWVDAGGIPLQVSTVGKPAAPTTSDNAAIMSTDSATAGWPGGDYSVTVPGVLIWKSNVTQSEFGNVSVNLGFRDVQKGNDLRPWSAILSQPTGRREFDLNLNYAATDDIYASNYFREAGLELKVEFTGDGALSKAAPAQTITNWTPYATPNKSLIEINSLLTVTDKSYDAGVKAADKLVRTDLGKLRKAARVVTYAQASATGVDLMSKDDLVRDAAIKGVTAFKEEVSEAISRSETNLPRNFRVAMAGPSIAFQQ